MAWLPLCGSLVKVGWELQHLADSLSSYSSNCGIGLSWPRRPVLRTLLGSWRACAEAETCWGSLAQLRHDTPRCFGLCCRTILASWPIEDICWNERPLIYRYYIDDCCTFYAVATIWVRLWSDASYLLAAEAQRKDYVVELLSEDVFTYNDQVVKQLTMISEKTTIKEARQSIQCAWNANRRSANIFSELASWRLGNGRNPRCYVKSDAWWKPDASWKPDAWWWPQWGISLEERWAYVHNSVWRCFGWGSATLLVTCEC